MHFGKRRAMNPLALSRSDVLGVSIAYHISITVFAAVSLAACGGQAVDTTREQAAGGTAGATDASGGAGGRVSTGGTSSGGASASNGAGGANGGSGGATPLPKQYTCRNWDELENEPRPGKVGSEACPSFDELDPPRGFVGKACVWDVSSEAVVPTSPASEVGDCCYEVYWLTCR